MLQLIYERFIDLPPSKGKKDLTVQRIAVRSVNDLVSFFYSFFPFISRRNVIFARKKPTENDFARIRVFGATLVRAAPIELPILRVSRVPMYLCIFVGSLRGKQKRVK